MKYIFQQLILGLFILTSACEDKSNLVGDNLDPYPNETGNLYVNNQLNEPLLLYRADDLLKEVPPNSGDFLVNIASAQGSAVDLKIWRKNDVDDFDNPDESNLYRRWVVLLSPDTLEENRAHWIIDLADVSFTGQVNFSYPDLFMNGNENVYNVDVYLNQMSGAKIVSLSPGDSINIGLGYNIYNLYYFYWYSDEINTDGMIPVGWYDGSVQILLNSGDDSEDIVVPTYDDSSVGRKGSIIIINNLSEIIRISANNLPISYHMAEVIEANSLLDPGDSFLFSIQTANYIFEARDFENTVLFESIDNIDIVEEYEFNWNVDGVNDLEGPVAVSVNNGTGYRFTLHDYFSDSYLGYFVGDNSVNNIFISTTQTSIKALDYTHTVGAILYPLNESWEINLTDILPISDLNLISRFNASVFEISNCDNTIIDTMYTGPYYPPALVEFRDISLSAVDEIEYWEWNINGSESIYYPSNYSEFITQSFDETGTFDVSLTISAGGIEKSFSMSMTFINKPVVLTYPNCSTSLTVGTDINISWDYDNQLFSNDHNIYISLNDDVDPIKVTNIGALHYVWNVDSSYVSDYNKFILTVYHSGEVYRDESDEYISISY